MPTFEQTWLPYLYLYGVGGLCFIIGMITIKKSGAIDLAKKRHNYWWKVMIFGMVYFMIIHALLIIVALNF